MNSFPLRQLILPAVLVASGVFSVLTLPLALYRPNSVNVELPFFEGELQPVFESGNRDLAIRYVGCAIVTSVAAGVATVELKRRSHNHRQAALEAALKQSEDSLNPPIEQTLTAFAPAPTIFDSVDEYFAAAASATELPSLVESDKLEVLDNPDRYQTCRIQVPETDRRFFAILVNGDYYRLFRARKTKEKATQMADRLRQRGDRVMLTATPQGYALWIWEPEAFIGLG